MNGDDQTYMMEPGRQELRFETIGAVSIGLYPSAFVHAAFLHLYNDISDEKVYSYNFLSVMVK
jgi:hypothetical protein